MNSAGHVNPTGRSVSATRYAAKPTVAVGLIRREDVPIAFRVFRPRPYTRRGTFSSPPPIPMLPERKPGATVAGFTASLRGGVAVEAARRAAAPAVQTPPPRLHTP